MLNNRILSSIIGIPVVYLFILWGGFPYYLLILGLMIGGLYEFYTMCNKKGIVTEKFLAIIFSILLVVNSYLISNSITIAYWNNFASMLITFFVMTVFIVQLIKNDIKSAINNSGATFIGILYVTWMLLHAIMIREIKPFGFQLICSIIVSTWSADIGAFFIGSRFGKRRLHIVSPNKSVIGAVSSVIFGGFGMLISKIIFKLYFVDVYKAVFLGIMIGIMAVLGDLVESLIKRNLGQKDSGKFLPGHGGVLDRIDSILFTVPFSYYYIKLVL